LTSNSCLPVEATMTMAAYFCGAGAIPWSNNVRKSISGSWLTGMV